MKLLVFLTICFITFELLKLVMLKTYWRLSINRRKHPTLLFLEFFYLIYLLGLFFVSYWYVGLSVLIISIITAFQLVDDVQEKSKFNKHIGSSLLSDGIVSIGMLSIILFKELL